MSRGCTTRLDNRHAGAKQKVFGAKARRGKLTLVALTLPGLSRGAHAIEDVRYRYAELSERSGSEATEHLAPTIDSLGV